jgi:hypothetical protein
LHGRREVSRAANRTNRRRRWIPEPQPSEWTTKLTAIS